MVVAISKIPASRVAGQHGQLTEEAGLWRKPGFFLYGARSESRGQKPGFFGLPDHEGATRTRSRLRIRRSACRLERRGRRHFKNPGFARGGSTRATHGRSRALAEARLFLLRGTFRIARPKAGILRLPDHEGTTRTRSRLRIRRSACRLERRGRRQFKNPGFARGGSTRATHGRSRALAEARLFLLRGTFRIARPKAGILRAARPRGSHPHQEPPENSTQRLPP